MIRQQEMVKKKNGYWLTGIHTSARTHSGPLVAGFFNLSIIIADTKEKYHHNESIRPGKILS